MVTVCGAVPYKGLIRLLMVEVYMYQVLVRLVYIENVDVLNMQIYGKVKTAICTPSMGIIIAV